MAQNGDVVARSDVHDHDSIILREEHFLAGGLACFRPGRPCPVYPIVGGVVDGEEVCCPDRVVGEETKLISARHVGTSSNSEIASSMPNVIANETTVCVHLAEVRMNVCCSERSAESA